MSTPERKFKPVARYMESPGSSVNSGYYTPITSKAWHSYPREDAPFHYNEENERPVPTYQFVKVIAILIVFSCILVAAVEGSRLVLVHFFADSKVA